MINLKQALVLAGGGSKGAYQAGCIKALIELGYNFNIVTGTSVGALNALLVVQKDYEALYKLWDEIKISDVLKDPINLNFSIESMISQTNLIEPFFKSYINEKGADITPLKKKICSLYNDKKFIESNKNYLINCNLKSINNYQSIKKIIIIFRYIYCIESIFDIDSIEDVEVKQFLLDIKSSNTDISLLNLSKYNFSKEEINLIEKMMNTYFDRINKGGKR